MTPKLDLAFTMHAYLSKGNLLTIAKIKNGPSRDILPITHGFLNGSGLNSTVLPGGADWALVENLLSFV
jgi:hypothetical protein